MTNRIYEDDAEALEGARKVIAHFRERWWPDRVEQTIDEELAAIDRAISALRSAQDVERRIVEAEVDAYRYAFDEIRASQSLAEAACRVDEARERIAELRASLERKDEP